MTPEPTMTGTMKRWEMDKVGRDNFTLREVPALKRIRVRCW